MPLKDIEIKNQEDMEFEVVPEDVYICRITDLEEVDGQDYNGNPEKQIQIKLKIMEGEYKDKTLVKRVSPKINAGFEGGSPSKLYVFLRAVFPESAFEDIKINTINQSISRKVKAMVKVKVSGKGYEYNAISDFIRMPREEIEKDEQEAVNNELAGKSISEA